MSVFSGQTLLLLSLETGYDLSTVSIVRIIYKKPDETVGSWVGAIDGTAITFSEFTDTMLTPGTWKFQAEVETADGKKARGSIVEYEIEEKL